VRIFPVEDAFSRSFQRDQALLGHGKDLSHDHRQRNLPMGALESLKGKREKKNVAKGVS